MRFGLLFFTGYQRLFTNVCSIFEYQLKANEVNEPSTSVHGKNLSRLGWKRAGLFFLGIITGIVIYSVFFR